MSCEKAFSVSLVKSTLEETSEQKRRLVDKEGEFHRRAIAHKVANMIPKFGYELKHVPCPVERKFLILEEEQWTSAGIFNQGWAALKNAAQAVSCAASGAAEATVEAVEKVGQKTVEVIGQTAEVIGQIGQKTTDAAIQLSHKTSEVAHLAAHKTSEIASEVGHVAAQIPEVASTIASKTSDVATQLSGAAVELGHKTSDAAIKLGHKTSEVTHAILESEAATKVGQAVEGAVHKIQDFAEDMTHASLKLYVHAQEQVEQTRRMASGDEQYALLHALWMSSKLAELDTFYKQCPPVNRWYAIHLLECMERKSRMYESFTGIARTNANKEAKLICDYLASKVISAPMPPVKVLYEETVIVTPLTPNTAAQ